MPNALRKPVAAPAPADLSADPMKVVRTRADALYRAAVECCRQHDRAARLSTDGADPELEHKHLDALCAMCDGSLEEIAQSYSEAAADLHPAKDEPWWHKANNLWHAAREYARRHAGCDAVSKKLSARHNSEQLATLQMEYELEASSLLALRHAADAYRKTRPQLV
jgi:hypothetical protein